MINNSTTIYNKNYESIAHYPLPVTKIRGPKILEVAKGNVSFCHHLASVVCRPLTFHILIFSETPQSNELKLGRTHLWKVFYYDLMDRDKMSNLYREPAIDASY
jgi:hypothetical protein